MLWKKQPWQWPLTLEKNTASQRTCQTSQPSLQDEAPREFCLSQIGPAGTPQLLPRRGRNLIAIRKVQLFQGRVAQDFQQVCGPIGTGVIVKAPGVLKRRLCGEKDGNLSPLLLQVTFASPTIWNCLFHIFGLSMLSNVVKETAVTMALNIGKKTRRLNELTKHRNQVCKTRHPPKRASLKLVQLAPRSFCHAADGIWRQPWKFNFSRGELHKTSSRSAAPSAPLVSLLKHLEWSKGDCGDKEKPSVAVPLASDFCQSDHLQLCIWHFWPFNVVKCCQRNSHDNRP